ncbi:IclR family transcriptional regulator [Streptomyces sp. NPDC006332]|uniref:IclR family transcriptional regulator n=1 Tax=Streptomyces sp. NPDC006332 TaxID=3155456 RepID=UPI0033B085DB
MSAEPPKPTTSNMRSLERAIDVLEVLDDGRQPLRLIDIARQAGLPVATTQRILNVLEARGRVERDATGYRPGLGLLFGAHAYLSTSPLVLTGRPVMQDLAAETGLTVSLFKRADWRRVVLARVVGTHPVRYEMPIGERLPLHLGAGKVLAAAMDQEEVSRLFDELDNPARANGTILTREDFFKDLEEIRRRGYAHSVAERDPGVASVAASITTAGSTSLAAVQVLGPREELPAHRIEALGIEVQRAAFAISRRIS